MKKSILVVGLSFILASTTIHGAEVNKGEIPAEHLDVTVKELPWNIAVWDNAEAIDCIKGGSKNCLWVDTRPSSFYDNGTVRDAIVAVYDKKDSSYPETETVLTEELLKQKISEAGIDPAQAKIIFFCQGPKCHRSYNAAYTAVTDWGYAPEQIIWYRDGYPNLLKAVREDPKLKRRAKKLLSDSALKTL